MPCKESSVMEERLRFVARLLDGKAKLDTLCGVGDFVLHDLRRTASTNLVRLGVHPHVRERVLNHVIPGVEGVYDRYSWIEERREALNTYDTFLRNLLAG